MMLDIFLCLADRFILMVALPSEHHEWTLTVAIDLDSKELGCEDCDLAACVLLNQVQEKVPVRVGSAACVDASFFGNDLVVGERYLRKHIPECIRVQPMRRTMLAIQQSSRRQQERAHAQACNLRSLLVLVDDPRHEVMISFQGRTDVSCDCRNEDQVCVVYLFVYGV